MKVPSSPKKRYLSGADWCIAALSQGTAETTGRRVVFQVAVFLEGAPDLDRLEAEFRAYCARFPVLWGKSARCWCLAPYWRFPSQAPAERPLHIGRSALPESAAQADVLRQVEALTNLHAARPGWVTALDCVQVGAARCVLIFSFDHSLFDAVGAETFINLFFRQANREAGEAEFPAARPTAGAQLDQWCKKFRSGQKVNRMMRRLAEGATTWLAVPRDARQRPFRFRVATFSAEESRRIQERAFQVAGYLMFTPYVLATAAAVFHPFFSRRTEADAHFVVSVSTDKPKSAVRTPHIFFNDLSFLYFRFPVAEATDRDALAGVVREQLMSQAREGVPAAIEDANLLMRIFPERAYWKFLMLFYRNRLSSFGFTCLGESAIKAPAVLGCRVFDQIHFPVIPTPPGIGLILSRSGGGYHAVLSYIEGILPEDEVDGLLDTFRARLLE
jgi:hypothetical protein